MLSRYEVIGQQASFDTYDEFQSLDYNRNGTIERNEWHWSRPSFAELDANRDGVISRRELEDSGVGSGEGQAPGVRPRFAWTLSGAGPTRGCRCARAMSSPSTRPAKSR